MKEDDARSLSERWALLRFSIVGPVLASPPPTGELRSAITELTQREWLHPGTGKRTRFGFSTIERWYYQALQQQDPVRQLRRRPRSDRRRSRAISEPLAERLKTQYRQHPRWSYQLHFDNLKEVVRLEPTLGRMPSYATLRRYMKANGLRCRRRTRRPDPRQPEITPVGHEEREVRSYESEYVNALWHTDFHHGSLPVLLPEGRWQKPIAFGALDDCSRYGLHVQWYLSEATRSYFHGLSQAFHKHGLPRSKLSDCGAAMTAAETVEGLERLSILQVTTRPRSPWQNGKQEIFWAQLEGRLLAMLEGRRDLTLHDLNVATQIWLEDDYNRKVHRELGCSPLERYLAGPDRGRPCPDPETLRAAFTMQVVRRQRFSDGTISLESRRYEVPAAYRHLERITVRYARWDLGCVFQVDPATGDVIGRLYPLDKVANSDGRRRRLPEPTAAPASEPLEGDIAPWLKSRLDEQAARGIPAPYIPLDETSDEENER